MRNGLRLVIAAGGSGGHVLPGISLAEFMLRSGDAAAVMFIGADGGLETKIVPSFGFNIKTLPVGRVRGMKLGARVAGLAGLGVSVPLAMGILREFKADVVVGMGGFASAPAVIAACMTKRPRVLCEQNTIPGSTNRWLARFVDRICVAYSMSSAYMPSHKVIVTGTPVRARILEAASRRAVQERGKGFRIGVLGGSQGARFLNVEVARALAAFAEMYRDVEIVHQAGAGREGEAAQAYQGLIRAKVVGYIEDMGEMLEWADLVVARAGATTLAELSCVGVPSFLIPFPFATDNHQLWNARLMEAAGGSRMFVQESFNEDLFLDALTQVHADRKLLENMGARALRSGRPDAARKVVEVIRGVL